MGGCASSTPRVLAERQPSQESEERVLKRAPASGQTGGGKSHASPKKRQYSRTTTPQLSRTTTGSVSVGSGASQDDSGRTGDQSGSRSLPPLMQAVSRGDMAAIKKMLKDPRVDVNVQCNDGTPLMVAAGHGDADIVRLLLSSPDIDVNIRNKFDTSAFHVAVEYGNPACVEAIMAHQKAHAPATSVEDVFCDLLHRNTDPATDINKLAPSEITLKDPQNEQTLLHLLTEVTVGGHDGTSPGSPTPSKRGQQLKAARAVELARALVQRKECAVNVGDKYNCTPLHLAVSRGNLEMTRVLVQVSDVTRQCDEGDTVLHKAVDKGDSQMLQLLLDNGADEVVNTRNDAEQTAYMMACSAAEWTDDYDEECLALLKPKPLLQLDKFSTECSPVASRLYSPAGSRYPPTVNCGQTPRSVVGVTDWLFEPQTPRDELMSRSVRVYSNSIRPLLIRCGLRSLEDGERLFLEKLLNDTRGSRSCYVADFHQISSNALLVLEESFEQVQGRLVNDSVGKTIVEKIPMEEYFGEGVNAQTLHQFSDECLGHDRAELIQRAQRDDSAMLQVMKDVLPTPESWMQLRKHGKHEVLDKAYEVFWHRQTRDEKEFNGSPPDLSVRHANEPVSDFRKHLGDLLLLFYAHKLANPFHKAVQRAFQHMSDSIEYHSSPCLMFGEIRESAKGNYEERSILRPVPDELCGQFCANLFRCDIVVRRPVDMISAIELLKSMTLEKNKMELRKLSNFHSKDAQILYGYRDITASVIFQHNKLAMLGEIRLTFHQLFKATKIVRMLIACERGYYD